MDVTTLLGMGLVFAVIAMLIIFTGSLTFYWDLEAFVISVGGLTAASLLTIPLNLLQRTIKAMAGLLFASKFSPKSVVPIVRNLAEKARKEGIYSIKDDWKGWPDDFLRMTITLIIMNTKPETTRKMMENEIFETRIRHKEIISATKSMGLYGPVFGLFGTLVGVIQVLRKIGDPASVGPAMATAVIASVYGILMAYVIFHPASGKLRLRSDEELLAKEMLLEGLLMIQAGEMPSMIERYMLTYLARMPLSGK